MHERSPKSSAIETLLYERDMLRHCAETVGQKQQRFQRSHSEIDQAEYYLGIEGFLLHFRNLLGFFINRGNKPTDLIVKFPERWAGANPVNQEICNDLTTRAKAVNKKHGLGDGDCYQKISWFLQHCTVYRHIHARSWDVDAMFADLEPVLSAFFGNFAPHTVKGPGWYTAEGASTGTITRSAPLIPDDSD